MRRRKFLVNGVSAGVMASASPSAHQAAVGVSPEHLRLLLALSQAQKQRKKHQSK